MINTNHLSLNLTYINEASNSLSAKGKYDMYLHGILLYNNSSQQKTFLGLHYVDFHI